MITISRVDTTYIENDYRTIKVEEYGAKTADECSPFGDDSCPLTDTDAIFAETDNSSESVIIGYIQDNRKALPGEKRIYSLKLNEDLSTYIWLKNNGKILINGDKDNLVKYTPLEVELKAKIELLNTELIKIQTAINSLGGAYMSTPLKIDISKSKTENILTE